MIKINNLSDKELVNIFHRLKDNQYLFTSIGLSCKRWYSLQVIACRTVQNLTFYTKQFKRSIRKHSLTVWFANETKFVSEQHFLNSSIRVDESKLYLDLSWEYIANRFTNVKSFNSHGVKLDSIKLSILFNSWSTSLEELTLVSGAPSYGRYTRNWDNFWRSIGALKALKHLFLYESVGKVELLFSGDVMSQLESLLLYLDDQQDCLRLFQNIGINLKRLTLIVPNGKFAHRNDFKSIINKERSRFCHLTHFGLIIEHGPFFSAAILRMIGRNFTSLTHLDFSPPYNCQYELEPSSALQTISNLTHLRITMPDDGLIRYCSTESCDDNDDDDYENAKKSRRLKRAFRSYLDNFNDWDRKATTKNKYFLDPIFVVNIKPLLGLRSLHLVNIEINRWKNFDILRKAFPNIREIHFDECDLVLHRVESNKSAPVVQLLLEQFRQFDHLESIYKNGQLLLRLNDDDIGHLNNLEAMKVLCRKRTRNPNRARLQRHYRNALILGHPFNSDQFDRFGRCMHRH